VIAVINYAVYTLKSPCILRFNYKSVPAYILFVLSYSVLSCFVLYCLVLSYSVLSSFVLSYSVLSYSVLSCPVYFSKTVPVLHCPVTPHDITPHHTHCAVTPHNITPHHTTPHNYVALTSLSSPHCCRIHVRGQRYRAHTHRPDHQSGELLHLRNTERRCAGNTIVVAVVGMGL
jgi:hypothetical protein